MSSGSLSFTFEVVRTGSGPSESDRRYAELNRAATEAKEHDYNDAVTLLVEAKTIKGDMYEDTRLAKFLQLAGRLDDALAEIKWLEDRVTLQVQNNIPDAPASHKQMLRAVRFMDVYRAAALICKRGKRADLREGFLRKIDLYADLWERLEPIMEADYKRMRKASRKRRQGQDFDF